MKIRNLLVLVLAMQAVATVSYVQAAPNVNTAVIAHNLARFQDQTWQDRREAFYALLSAAEPAPREDRYAVPSAIANVLRADPAGADAAKLAFINLLKRENALVVTGTPDLTDEYSDYYADVIGGVASLNDPRAIDALIGAIETGDMATNGLGRLGAAAFDKTAAVFASGHPGRRESALMVFSAMLDGELKATTPNTVLRNRIEVILQKGLSDPNPHLRMAAIEGASKLRTPALMASVQRLAREDRYEASEHGGDRGVFLVRDAAERALKSPSR